MNDDDETQLLHRYVDGDLTDAEQAALRASAASDPTVRARIEGLLEVRRLVAEVAEDASRDLDADALFAGIEAKLAAEPAGVDPGADQSVDELTGPRRPALRVIPGGRAAGEADGAPKAPAEVPAEVRRRRVIGVVIAGFAVAAAAVIALTQFGEAPEVARIDEPAAVPTGPITDPGRATAEPARTEVLEVDFGTNAGTIFSVEGETGERFVVVWLEEAPAAAN